MMTRNVGGKDRLIRIIVGAAIFIFGIVTNSWLGFIGLIILSTGMLSWCPAYLLFGLNTRCGKESCEDENKED